MVQLPKFLKPGTDVLILRGLVYNAGLADVGKWALLEHDNLMWWEMDAPWIHQCLVEIKAKRRGCGSNRVSLQANYTHIVGTKGDKRVIQEMQSLFGLL